jgi:SAM-dependent methyltransferase
VQGIQDLREAGKTKEALALAWHALEAAPGGRAQKHAVARILRDDPDALDAGRAGDYLRLLTDPQMDPSGISMAGWTLLLRDDGFQPPERDPAELAATLEHHPLALALLMEDAVCVLAAEQALTGVRRWLLCAGRWRDFPTLGAALRAQAALNGGAWPFGDDERARLADAAPDAVLMYLPRKPEVRAADDYGDAVTRAVAAQYEGWPYPPWRRLLHRPPTTLADEVRKRDPDWRGDFPTPADILVAGCGTGRQAALIALRYPRDRITAIDISEASLDYARSRCAANGIDGIAFQRLDLHEAGRLGKSFDAIMCTGVLHHLPDPEKGWEALVGVLKPGGIMHIMVYSRLARMRVAALRKMLGEVPQPIDDDRLRDVRRRVMGFAAPMIPASRDFFSLAAVHDLLVHRHEDPFDVARIRRALERFGLELLRLDLPTPHLTARYRERFPHDPLRRDLASLARMELDMPTLFASMYDFWCRKPG